MSGIEAQIEYVKQLPVVILDNFYDENETKLMMQELCYYNSTGALYEPEKVGVAHHDDGRVKKKGKSVFLDPLYNDRDFSNILRVNRKIFLKEITDQLCAEHHIFKYLQVCNRDNTMISYFENSDYYESHHDSACITVLSWLYREPRRFSGGDLIIENDLKIDCFNNRTIVFPSILEHEVTKIEMDKRDMNQDLGRFCITQFISFQ